MTPYPWLLMDEKEPTQRTDKGTDIPVPSREDFFDNMEKVAKPDADADDDSEEPK